MIKCESCGKNIDDRTDDNYNAEHTKIQCPDCYVWNDLSILPRSSDIEKSS